MSVRLWLVAYGGAVGAGLLLLGLLFAFTNPKMIGPIGVTIWFVLVWAWLASVFTLLLYGFKAYFRIHGTGAARLRYARRQGALIGAWLAGMLSLSSLGQLGWLDGILLGILIGIVEVYVRFRWP